MRTPAACPRASKAPGCRAAPRDWARLRAVSSPPRRTRAPGESAPDSRFSFFFLPPEGGPPQTPFKGVGNTLHETEFSLYPFGVDGFLSPEASLMSLSVTTFIAATLVPLAPRRHC